MKKTDIAMLILIASVSVIIAFVVANTMLKDLTNNTAQVETIELIKPGVEVPSPEIFNKNAINPSVQVEINGTK